MIRKYPEPVSGAPCSSFWITLCMFHDDLLSATVFIAA